MPLYEYECESCGRRFERIQKFSDAPIAECPTCGGPVRKLMSSPAIQFKGSGFYITDYAKPGSSSDATSGDKASKSDKTTDKASPESTPASSSDKSDKKEPSASTASSSGSGSDKAAAKPSNDSGGKTKTTD
jgi:putative FmdB family regulatory protein